MASVRNIISRGVLEDIEFLVNSELETLNSQWYDVDDMTFKTLQGKAKALNEFLLIFAPYKTDKQDDGGQDGG